MSNSSWKNGVSGDWSVAADWAGGVPNDNTTTASIAAAGDYTVTIGAAENFSIAALNLDAAGATLSIAGTLSLNGRLSLAAGTLSIAGTLTLNKGFDLLGGTIGGAGTLNVIGGSVTEPVIRVVAGATLSVANMAISSGVILQSNLTLSGGLSLSGNGIINRGANALTVGSLSVSGTINGTGNLTVTGAATLAGFLCNGGTILLLGSTTDQGILEWAGVLENAGIFTWTGGDLGDAFAGTLNNDSGANFDIQSDNQISHSNSSPGAFINAGTITKSITGGVTKIVVPFTNSGMVSVETGTLEFDGGGTSSASAFTVAPDAVLQFGAYGSFKMTGGTYDIAGRTSIAGGTADFSAATIASFGAGGLTVSGGVLELGGQNASVGSFGQSGGTIDGTGALTITGAANISTAAANVAWTGTGTTLLTGATTEGSKSGYFIAGSGPYWYWFTLDGDRVLENAGTFTWIGGPIGLGVNPIGPPLGGGTIKNDFGANFNIQIDSQVVGAQASSGIASGAGANAFINAGTVTQSVTTGTTAIGVSFTNTGTVAVETGTLEFTGAFTNDGLISGAGTLALSGGTATLGAGSRLTVSNLSLSNHYLLQVAADLVYGGTLLSGTGTGIPGGEVNIASGATLKLTGSATFFDTLIDGAGTLLLDGTATPHPGSKITVANLSLSDGGLLQLKYNSTYSGALTQTGGELYIGTPATLKLTGSAFFAKSLVDGGGTLSFSGGTETLGAGFVIATGAWTIANGVVVMDNANVSFSGSFSDGASSLNLGDGNTLKLTGSASFAGSTIDGAGRVWTLGATSVAGLTLGRAARWLNYGTATETAAVTVGDASGKTSIIINETGATYDIVGDFELAPNAGGVGLFANRGLLEKTAGAGTSIIGLTVQNPGTIIAGSGTLEISGAVSGTGALRISSAATLQVDDHVAATQTLAFSGSGGKLVVGDAVAFKATISGFAAGDTLDLKALDFGGAPTLAFTENATNTQGTLTVTDGALHGSFTLLGQYAAAGFHAGDDSGTGTAITYTPPSGGAAALELAAHH